MIPQEKSAAVTQALHEAFGVTAFDDIRPLTQGNATHRVFRMRSRKGSPFVLKITMRADDPTRNYTNMRATAEAGLAPRVMYTSIEDKISITDFVDAVPLPMADALVRVPATLRTLHALPPFAGVPDRINTSCMFLLNQGATLDGFIQRFRSANLLPEAEKEELLALAAQLAAAYPRHDPQMVSSHNDLFKPDNILFDGHRVCLIDFEAAFLNDRYADLAVVANMLLNNDADERTFLQECFGQPPNEYQLARLFFMRQVAHVFYTMAFVFANPSREQLNLQRARPRLAALPTPLLGRRDRPVGQTGEARLCQVSLGAPPADRAPAPFPRIAKNRLRPVGQSSWPVPRHRPSPRPAA